MKQNKQSKNFSAILLFFIFHNQINASDRGLILNSSKAEYFICGVIITALLYDKLIKKEPVKIEHHFPETQKVEYLFPDMLKSFKFKDNRDQKNNSNKSKITISTCGKIIKTDNLNNIQKQNTPRKLKENQREIFYQRLITRL